MAESSASPVAIALLIALTSLLTGCATSPDARTARVERHAQRAALILANRTDADSLAAAGVLSRGGVLSEEKHPDRSSFLIAQAAAVAPERPDLAWLQSQACQEAPACEVAPVESRLRALDPSNGAGWMGALARADKSGDAAAVDAALVAISKSDRVDIYWTTLIAHLDRAASRAKTMSLSEAGVIVIGYLAMEAIPAYGAASRACKGESLQKPGRIEVCRGVAMAFERGDTYITEMIGIAIAKRVWPEDSPEYKAAVEARRVYEYRSDKFVKSAISDSKRSAWAAERYVALCEQNHREQDVFLAQLIDAGENPNPPPEWTYGRAPPQ